MLKESQILKTLNPVTVFSTSFKPTLVHLLIYFFHKTAQQDDGGCRWDKAESKYALFHNNLNTVTEYFLPW